MLRSLALAVPVSRSWFWSCVVVMASPTCRPSRVTWIRFTPAALNWAPLIRWWVLKRKRATPHTKHGQHTFRNPGRSHSPQKYGVPKWLICNTITVNYIIIIFSTILLSISWQANGDILKTSYTNFASLVQNLLNVPFEKEFFFQVSLFVRNEYLLKVKGMEGIQSSFILTKDIKRFNVDLIKSRDSPTI